MQLSVADVAIQMLPHESAHELATVLCPIFPVTPPGFKFLNLVDITSDARVCTSATLILH